MIFDIGNRILIGDKQSCPLRCSDTFRNDKVAIIHATKTCHRKYLGYKKSLPKSDLNYLFVETKDDLYLNMIDPDKPLFFDVLFIKPIEFIEKNVRYRDVLIHCDAGMSRSPTIAMLYLMKIGVIKESGFTAAARIFKRDFYQQYEPGTGISLYVHNAIGDLV